MTIPEDITTDMWRLVLAGQQVMVMIWESHQLFLIIQHLWLGRELSLKMHH